MPARREALARPSAVGPSAVAVPFALACTCGQVQRGDRQAQPQTIACPHCGRKHFVFPISPWPTTDQDLASWIDRLKAEPAEKPEAVAARSAWRQPLWAAGITLMLVLALLAGGWVLLKNRSAQQHAGQVQGHRQEALEALHRGDLQAAHTALERARQEIERAHGQTVPDDARTVLSLHRQVELALFLLEPALEELLAEAASLPARQWETRFREAYLGRGVLFDALVEPGREGISEARIDYELKVDGVTGQVSASDFNQARTLFGDEQPRRWILGGKLAAIKLEADAEHPAGQWFVRMQPESLVLVTHAGVLKALGLAEEREWDDVLRFQSNLPVASLCPALVVDVRHGDPAQEVRRQLGPPDRLSRQVLKGRYIEQWIYARMPTIRLNVEHRPGQPPRVAKLAANRPR